jgi:hypothetical protein
MHDALVLINSECCWHLKVGQKSYFIFQCRPEDIRLIGMQIFLDRPGSAK